MAAERLNDIMKESAHQHLWTFAEGHRATFRGRGLCAGYSDAPWTMADELRVPRKINGVWEPFNPSQWRAYAPRQRLFRTPNDAYMTGNFHVGRSLTQKALSKQGYGWVQLLLASVYSGAFHPSAEGQAAIADAVVEQARGVLAKYASRAPPRPEGDRPGLGRRTRASRDAPATDDPDGSPQRRQALLDLSSANRARELAVRLDLQGPGKDPATLHSMCRGPTKARG